MSKVQLKKAVKPRSRRQAPRIGITMLTGTRASDSLESRFTELRHKQAHPGNKQAHPGNRLTF